MVNKNEQAYKPGLEVSLFQQGHKAADAYANFSLAQVEKIAQGVVKAAKEKSHFYAEWAVRETGFGDVESKTVKNEFNLSVGEQDISGYISPQIDTENKVVKFPKPAGVIVALVPCTNPIATIYYKVICALITRNAIILCPHPAAKECSNHAAKFMSDIAIKLGAPAGLIQFLEKPSVDTVGALMKSDQCSLILATGGPAMVRAAYSSSNPAIGVGPGNVGCYVHETADTEKAAEYVVSSVGFDNSLPCTTESVVVVDRIIADNLMANMEKSGVYFISDAQALRTLREFLFPDNHLNPKAIGKSAQWIADQCNISIPQGTKVLGIEIFTIGHHEPVSNEKMFPVVGLIRVDGGVQSGIRTVLSMLDISGKGHSAVVHANDPNVIARYGDALPVCRIAVNTSGVTGSSGFTTNLSPGAVIGTGFFGRSSIDENVGPKHLIQYTRVAYNKEPSEVMGDIKGAVTTLIKENEHKSIAALPTVIEDEALGNLVNKGDLHGMIKDILKAELLDILGEK